MPGFHWWRTVFFLIPAIGLYTAVLGTVSVIAGVAGQGRLAHGCARVWSWLILATTGVNVRVSGLERLDPSRTYLFTSNHQSIYDIPVVFWHLPYDLRIIAKASLGSFPFIGWHLRRTGHVLVRRDKPGAEVFDQVRQMMREGHSLIVFPEGTRSADGRVGRFRSGIFRLAIESGLDIVPVAIRGSRHVMRKGRLATSPGDVSLEVFAPISSAGLQESEARLLATRIRDVIGEAVLGDEDPGVAFAGEAPAGSDEA